MFPLKASLSPVRAPHATLVNIGSPLLVGMKPEFVAHMTAVVIPRRIETKRIAYNLVIVLSSLGKSRSTTILFFFFRAKSCHLPTYPVPYWRYRPVLHTLRESSERIQERFHRACFLTSEHLNQIPRT